METDTNGVPVPGKLFSRNLAMVVGAIAVIAVGTAGYFWWQASHDDPQAAARKEAEQLVAEVSQLIVLPEDEDPVIATVADPSQLQDTPFFAKAKVGDRVLIYNNARKAILYDPVARRILEVAPLNVGAEQ